MSYWAKFEKFQVVARKEGAIYKTKCVGFKWFKSPNFPKTDSPGDDDCLWVPTGSYHFEVTPPPGPLEGRAK